MQAEPEITEFRMLMTHQDQVLRLPPTAELLATSQYCPVAAYRIADHVFCVQGHPEFVPELSERLINARRPALGDQVADAALLSLQDLPQHPLDHRLVAEWTARFFQR